MGHHRRPRSIDSRGSEVIGNLAEACEDTHPPHRAGTSINGESERSRTGSARGEVLRLMESVLLALRLSFRQRNKTPAAPPGYREWLNHERGFDRHCAPPRQINLRARPLGQDFSIRVKKPR